MLLQSRSSCAALARPCVTRNSTSARPPCLAASTSSATTRCYSSRSVSSQQQRVQARGAAATPRTSASSSRVREVVCRARPQWGYQGPEPVPTGSALVKLINDSIKDADSITALEDVYNKWGGSFDYIHTAAAMMKCAKLSRGGRGARLFEQLAHLWLQVLPDAEARACSNVLWACSWMGLKDARLWEDSWEAYIKQQEQEVNLNVESGVNIKRAAQHISNALLASAKLRKQPAVDDLQLLVQMFVLPDVLAIANSQDIGNTAWALSQLYEQRDWRGGVSEQQLQRLLGQEQLQLLSGKGNAVDTSNVLLALARFSTGSAPLLSLSFAQAAAHKLLVYATQDRVRSWPPQEVSNSMWACSVLGLAEEQFVSAATAAAPQWLPNSTVQGLTQAARSVVELQLRDERFVQLLLQRSSQLVSQGQSKQQRGRTTLQDREMADIAAMCSKAVTQLNMQRLAAATRDIVARSGVGKQKSAHPGNLGKLWEFHSWLQQHQLLDRKGLTGVLTEQQLQQGAKAAADFRAQQGGR